MIGCCCCCTKHLQSELLKGHGGRKHGKEPQPATLTQRIYQQLARWENENKNEWLTHFCRRITYGSRSPSSGTTTTRRGQQTRCTPPGSGQARVEEHERKREYYEERYQWIVMAINSRTRTGHNDPQLHNDHFWTVYCNNCYLILFACNSSSSFFSTFVGVNLVALENTLAGVLFLALMCHYNFL